MWVVIFFGSGVNGLTLAVYGPYSTQQQANAAAFNAGQNTSQGAGYFVVQAFTPPTGNQSSPPTPIAVNVGQWVVVQAVVNLLGITTYNVYGVWATQLAAQQIALNLVPPSGLLVSQVQPPI